MKLQYTIGLILLMFINIGIAQENTVGTIVYDEEATDGGYNMIFPHNQPDAFLLDMCGNVVHTWENNDTLRPGNVIYLLENSDVITTHRPADFSGDAIWAGGGGATVERRTWDNELVWSFTRNDSAYRLHHDVEPMSNGNVLVIAWEKHDSLDCVEAGRDTTNLTGGGIWSEVVWEISPNDNMGADIIWEWAAWDHLIQDFDASKSNYGVIADNIDKIDINFGLGLQAAPDWLHINAIDYDDYSKHIMLSVPTFGEMWLIDKGNTTPGELKWRWGNPAAYDHG
ncbi:MAG: aryl-sulfate sulfotransferase, partial [Flavobacteriales bacterium]